MADLKEGPATKRVKAKVKEALVVAYQKLNLASYEYDLVDEAGRGCEKIAAVRKQVLALLQGEIEL